MIIQSILRTTDVHNHQQRNTIYTVLEDPVTRKRVIEAIEYYYDKTGAVEATNTKGRHVDTRA